MRKPHLLRSFEIYGRHRCIAEFIVYHRIIAEIDYHGMEAVLKPADVEVPINRPG